MGQMFSGLTKTGVTTPSGTDYYGSPAEAAIAAAQKTKAPTTVSIGSVPDLARPEVKNDAGDVIQTAGTQAPQTFTDATGSPGLDPKVATPTFQASTTDKYGNATLGPALTKKGVLLGLLKTGLQGGLDAVQGGALNAPRNGESTVGEGARAATILPMQRKQQALQQGAEEQEAEIRQNQIKNAPLLFGANLGKTLAETEADKARAGFYNAGTDKREQNPTKYVPGVGLVDTVTHQVVTKVDPNNIDPKTEFQLRYAAAQGDTDAQTAVDQLDKSRKGLKATAPGKATPASNPGDATLIASQFLNKHNGDAAAALADFNTQLPTAVGKDPRVKDAAPGIIAAIKKGGGKAVKPKATILPMTAPAVNQ